MYFFFFGVAFQDMVPLHYSDRLRTPIVKSHRWFGWLLADWSFSQYCVWSTLSNSQNCFTQLQPEQRCNQSKNLKPPAGLCSVSIEDEENKETLAELKWNLGEATSKAWLHINMETKYFITVIVFYRAIAGC